MAAFEAIEMPAASMSSWRGSPMADRLRLLLRVVLSLSLLGVAFWLGSARFDWRSLESLDAGTLAACFALTAFIIVSLAWRWRAIMAGLSQAVDVVPSLSAAIRLTWVSLAVNQVVPSVAGGDAARISQAAVMGVPLGRAAGSVALDRLYGLIGLALLALTGLHLLPHALILPVLAGFAALALIGVAILLAGRLSMLGKAQAMFRAAAMPWRKSAAMVLMAMLSHLANIAIFLVIAAALGANLPLLPAVSVMSCVLFVTVLPISVAGWGVREIALVQAFGQMGIGSDKIMLSSVAYGLVVLVTQASGFLLLVGRSRP